MEQLKQELRQLVIDSCHLEHLLPDGIAYDTPLFQEGVGLDSVDVLELAVAIERRYQVTIPDEQIAKRVLASIDALAEFVHSQSARPSI